MADNTEHATLKALHAHLRHFHIKQESYYREFFPRFCKGTGQPIPFKDRDQYFSQDFVDKNAIKKFIKSNPKEAREWAIGWLKKRKEEKGLIYAPSQVELRSLSCPTMVYFDTVGGYYHIARELGFKDRYVSYTEQNAVKAGFWDDKCIICDTREQLPLKFTVKTVRETVNAGDYALAGPHDQGVYIERKSISDFVGTMNARANVRENKKKDDTVFTNLERFDRELTRAAEQGHYIVMLIETSLTQALSFSYLPQMKWTKVSEQHVFKNLRDLLSKYPLSFQAVFADGRADAAQKALKIFEMGEQVRRVDLQYAVERGLL